MLLDGRTIAAGTELSADLCIIGAGAVGITLGLALANAPFSVDLLESGGLDPEGDSQDLARGKVTGLPYFPLESARMRCFGGSTQHWGGWCRPLDEVDFQARDWVPGSGWPITRADLDGYYARAQELCQLGEFDYRPDAWVLDDTPQLRLQDERVRTDLIQFSPPARFGVRYREQVLKAPNIRTVLHSNVVALEPDDDVRAIRRVRIQTLSGNAFQHRARYYVLATGGIDNPRLLLASSTRTPRGLGNANDLVGRYFSDHMQLDTASVFPLDGAQSLDLYQLSSRDRTRRSRIPGGRSASLMGYLALSRDVQRSERALNYSANLLQAHPTDAFLHTGGQTAAEDSWLSRGADALRTLWHNLTELADARQSTEEAQRFFKIVSTQEQAPNRDSRVTLSDEKDPLGVPRAHVHWQFNELDRHTIQVGIREIARSLGSAGIARINVPYDLSGADWPRYMQGSWHHCGTTRMHDDPKLGVVDASCRMHGIENLYVGGSSVFPTPGNGNPTLTIVALSLRLAEHLKRQMRETA